MSQLDNFQCDSYAAVNEGNKMNYKQVEFRTVHYTVHMHCMRNIVCAVYRTEGLLTHFKNLCKRAMF